MEEKQKNEAKGWVDGRNDAVSSYDQKNLSPSPPPFFFSGYENLQERFSQISKRISENHSKSQNNPTSNKPMNETSAKSISTSEIMEHR